MSTTAPRANKLAQARESLSSTVEQIHAALYPFFAIARQITAEEFSAERELNAPMTYDLALTFNMIEHEWGKFRNICTDYPESDPDARGPHAVPGGPMLADMWWQFFGLLTPVFTLENMAEWDYTEDTYVRDRNQPFSGAVAWGLHRLWTYLVDFQGVGVRAALDKCGAEIREAWTRERGPLPGTGGAS